MALRFGDALLVYGSRANFTVLGREPDFLVLTASAQTLPNPSKAKISIPVMAGLMLLTFLATCVIPTAALVVLMVPIILSTAADIGVAPYPLMMAMAMAASASFMTPISHPANVMVMGPGGYRFSDYIKIGLPLTLVVLVTVMLVLPVFWPFVPGH